MAAAPRNSAIDRTLRSGEVRLGVFARVTSIRYCIVDGWYRRRAPSSVRRVGKYRVINVAQFIESLSVSQRNRVLAALSEYESRKAEAAAKPKVRKWPRPDRDTISQWAWDKNKG